jgi:AraC-like DNA-binding protein
MTIAIASFVARPQHPGGGATVELPAGSTTGLRPLSRDLRRPRGSGALIECIRELLAEQAPLYPGLDRLAAQCCIAPRTLKRRLSSSGLGYQDLLDQLRATHAMRLLAQPELSVERIAEQVGYSSAANFYRAFRRWTGSSPGAFREAMTPAASADAKPANGSPPAATPAATRPPAASIAVLR